MPPIAASCAVRYDQYLEVYMSRRIALPLLFLLVTALFTTSLCLAQDRLMPLITEPSQHLDIRIQAVNDGAEAATVQLTGYDTAGTPLATHPLKVGPGQAMELAADTLGNGVAYVRIEGSEAIGVAAFYAIDTPFGPWATVAETATHTRTWQWRPVQKRRTRQKIALVNTGYRDASFRLDLVQLQTGTVIDSYDGELTKSGHMTLDLEQHFNLPRVRDVTNFEEALAVTLTSSEPLATASLAINRNRQGLWGNPGRAIGPRPPVRLIPLSGADTFPEGVATNRQTGEVYVGGLGDGSIQRIVDGTSSYFVHPGQAGLKNVVGLEVDAARNRLWVCNSDFFTFQNPELVVFDTRDASELARFVLDDQIDLHFFNEVTIDPTGNAYATDSFGPAIWTVDADLQALDVFVEDATRFRIQNGFNLNGIIATPDGRYLIAALPKQDGSIVYRLDLATKAIDEITIDGLFVGGDGLTFANQTDLISVAFDVTLLRFDCNFDSAKRISFPSLTQHFDFATTGDIADGNLIVVNSQIDHFFIGESAPNPFTVAKVPLARLGLKP